MTTGTLTRRSLVAGLAGMLLAPSLAAQTITERRFPRGARLPSDLRDRIRAQNLTTKTINEALKSDLDFRKFLKDDSSIELALPTRYLAKVTPVKDQQTCGSCWVFAATGAYEAAYLKFYNDVINISEQQVLDCAFSDYNCVVGGWHDVAFLYLRRQGVTDGVDYGYNNVKVSCIANVDRPYFATNWGYVVDDVSIPPDTALKKAILTRGALACAVFTDAHREKAYIQFKRWDSYRKRYEDGTSNQDWSSFKDAIFPGIPSRLLKQDQSDHEILLAGWDDNLGDGCWIIKNSWGMNWGNEGLMNLPYGCNNIGLAASWVEPKKVDAPISTSLKSRLNDIELNNLQAFYSNTNILQ